MKSSDLLRKLPTMSDLLDQPQVKAALEKLDRSVVVTRVRGFLDELRSEVTQRAADLPLPTLHDVVDRVTRYVSGDHGRALTSAINATGRLRGGGWASGPLAAPAVERVSLLSADFVLDSAQENPPTSAAATLRRLTGAEAAEVFHSRAGLLALLITELAGGGPVVVARGEVSEVAPGCRLTDLCRAAGAKLREVGTAGAVSAGDYAEALSSGGVILRLQPEDHHTVGAPPRPPAADIAEAARQAGAVLIDDLAGGPLTELPAVEGVVGDAASQAIGAGAHLVVARGEGMIGGPECALLLGKRTLVERAKNHPLATAQQPAAATVAALAETVELWSDAERVRLAVPVLSLLSTPVENLQSRAERLALQIAESPLVASAESRVLSAEGNALSGLPCRLPSVAIAVSPGEAGMEALQNTLAAATPGVRGRVEGDHLLLDLRTVFPRQDIQLVTAFPPAEAAPLQESGDEDG